MQTKDGLEGGADLRMTACMDRKHNMHYLGLINGRGVDGILRDLHDLIELQYS